MNPIFAKIFHKFWKALALSLCMVIAIGLTASPVQAMSSSTGIAGTVNGKDPGYLFPSALLGANKPLNVAADANTADNQVDRYIYSNFRNFQGYAPEYESANIKYTSSQASRNAIENISNGAQSGKSLGITVAPGGYVRYVVNLMPDTNYTLRFQNAGRQGAGITEGTPTLYVDNVKMTEGDAISNNLKIKTAATSGLAPTSIELRNDQNSNFSIRSNGDWTLIADAPTFDAQSTENYTVKLSEANGKLLSELVPGSSLIFTDTANQSDFKGEPANDQRVSSAGDYTLRVTGNKWGASTNRSINIKVVDDTPDPSQSSFTVSDGNRLADGTATHTVTVTLIDKSGSSVLNADVTKFTAASDPANASFGAWTNNGDGTYTATITSTVAGAKTLTTAFDGSTIPVKGNNLARFVAGGVDVTNAGTKFTVTEGARVADGDGTHNVTVTLVDKNGNPVVDADTAKLVAVSDPANATFGSWTNNGDGTYTATITTTVAGDKKITTSFDSGAIKASGNDVARFTAGGVDVNNAGTKFTVTEGEKTADGSK